MSERAVAFVLPAASSDATVALNGPTADQWYRGQTTGDPAYWGLSVDAGLSSTYCVIERPGYLRYVQSLVLGTHDTPGQAPVAQQIRVGVPADPARPFDILLPPMIHVGSSMSIAGRDIVDVQGNRLCVPILDGYMWIWLALTGQDLTPYVREAQDMHASVIRILCQAVYIKLLDPRDPAYPAATDRVLKTCQDNGLTPLWTIFADEQLLNVGRDQAYRFRDSVGGYGWFSIGNEMEQNGWSSYLPFTDFGVPFWSQGSHVGNDAPPPMPTGTFMEFHQRRDWPRIMNDTVASPMNLYEERSPRYTVPLVGDEGGKMGPLDPRPPQLSSPVTCWEYGRTVSALWAAYAFHNYFGTGGQLMDSDTRTCCQEFFSGLRLA